MSLRGIVLDHQYRSVGSRGIPTVEPDEVRDRIVIVVRLEAQAELGDAREVNVGMSRGSERGYIPAAWLGSVYKRRDAGLARRILKVNCL